MTEFSAERRERVLRAMARCVVEEGIQGASLRKVAQRAGATTGMITHYFRSKNELIAETLRYGSQRFFTVLNMKPGVSRLLARFETRIRNRDPEVPSWKYYMEFWAASMRSEELRKSHVDASRTGRARFLEDVKAAIEAGDAEAGIDPETMADIIHSLYFGIGVLSTLDPEEFSEDRTVYLVEAATKRLLKGEMTSE